MAIALGHAARPFKRDAINSLYIIAQYQIFMTCFGGLIVSTNALSVAGLSSVALGSLLLGLNCTMIVVICFLLAHRWRSDREVRSWRPRVGPAQVKL